MPRRGRCDVDHGGEVVERAGAHLARLRTHDRRCVGVHRGGERRHVHPRLAVGGDHDLLLRSDPEEPERARHRHVALGSDDHPERRRTDEPSRGKIPAGTRVDRVPRRREAGDVRHLAAGDERERRVRGQPEELDHPAARERLEGGGRGRRLREPGVLVPRRHEPVGRDRCGQRAADDEAEVPAGAHRGDPGLEGRQLLDRPCSRRTGRPGRARRGRRASRGTSCVGPTPRVSSDSR